MISPHVSKTLRAAIAALALAILSAPLPAVEPPPRSTIQQRVDGAGNIFIGRAISVHVVKFVGGKPQPVTDEPELLSEDEAAKITIVPTEAMFPANWELPATLTYYFGGGQFNVAAIRDHVLNAKLIYPVAMDKNRGVYIPAYPWHLADTLDERAEFQVAIDARVKREQGNKPDAAGK
jgi:hypothetical protein